MTVKTILNKVGSSRILWLDELRGIAAFSVVLFHFFTNYNTHYKHSFEPSSLFAYGSLGVNLFFMISGFVIFMTVSKVNSLSQFIISRFSRLYPVFWVAVTITFFWTINFGPTDRVVDEYSFIVNLTMIHEYLSVAHVDKVYWTLSIELAFYFWIGILLISNQLSKINYYLIAVVAVSIFYDQVPQIIRQLFILKSIPFFAAGISFYLLHTQKETVLTKLLLTLVVIHILKFYPLTESILLLGIFIYFYFRCLNQWGTNKYLIYLGTISYSLYLIHQNIGYSLIQFSYKHSYHPLIGVISAIVFSILLATVLTYFIERPSAKICRKVFSKKTC